LENTNQECNKLELYLEQDTEACKQSIYLRGADAQAFSLVSGFPVYTVGAGQNKAAEFRFKPTRIGSHNAEIVIIAQSDTLYQNIIGEGVEPQLQIITDLVDFGKVELGNIKDTSDVVLIKNISAHPITINNVVQLGPDKTQFEILNGGGSFVLQSNETRAMDLRFKPVFGGRTSGQLGFLYNGVGSSAIA